MKLKAFKAKPKRDASPIRGKEKQEMGGLGTGTLKGPDTEFTSTVSSHQTIDVSTINPAKDNDIKARNDPSLNKMGGVWSSTGSTLTFNALIEDLAGAGEASLRGLLCNAS